MTSLLIAYLLVLLIPFVMTTWRTSLLGLALQGFLLGGMVLARPASFSATTLIVLLDLFVLRGLLAPLSLFRILRKHETPRHDESPVATRLVWALAATATLVAFHYAARLAPHDDLLATHFAVAFAGVALGLLVLATQRSAVNQMFGLLRIENAIALFELASTHHLSAALTGGMSVVYLLTVVLLGAFLIRLGVTAPSAENTPYRSTL